MQSCRCNAFTKGLRRCRNYADPTTALCRQHTTFYKGTHFLELFCNHLRIYDIPGKWIGDAIKASGLSSKEVCRWIETRHYSTETFSIQRRCKWLYSMAYQYGSINPLESMRLWENEVNRKIISWIGVPEQTLAQNAVPWIKPLFPDGVDMYQLICDRLCAQRLSPAAWGVLLRVILVGIHMAPVIFMEKEALLELSLKNATRTYTREQREEIRYVVGEILDSMKKDYMLAYRVALEPLKEELIAAALHPDRICPLIERYGIDVISSL